MLDVKSNGVNLIVRLSQDNSVLSGSKNVDIVLVLNCPFFKDLLPDVFQFRI